MEFIIKSKLVSYGLIEMCQNGSQYYIKVNGNIKEFSSDINTISKFFDKY